MTQEAFLCDAVRTPIGRYGGVLSTVRTDDLATLPIKTLLERYPQMDPSAIDDVILGCSNQAGEDSRNIGRVAALLAGLPVSVPGQTVNRLCGSGAEAIAQAARAIKLQEGALYVAGGVESMSRSPFVMAKPENGFPRQMAMADSTIGWRFPNPALTGPFGDDSMPSTGDNVARDYKISREDQDAYAYRSHMRAVAAIEGGRMGAEIVPVPVPQRKGDPLIIDRDEHPRADTSTEKMAKLRPVVTAEGTVTAGNAAGINDGAAATLVASEAAAKANGLTPFARIIGTAVAGVEPRIMGIGPIAATEKLLARLNMSIEQIDVIEINEAFASQVLATMRHFGLPDDAEHVNPNGGGISLGHPLGMSGARITAAAARELNRRGGRYALATMCIGIGQGIATLVERA